MEYVALLRGINAGKNRRVDMKRLKRVFENLGFLDVSTYINSGNVIFKTDKPGELLRGDIEKAINIEFGFEVATLVKTRFQIRTIAEAIPPNWQNDEEKRTDVAYLFKEIDRENIIDELPFNREFADVRYVPGAVFWNIDRKDYSQSRLNKLIGHKTYQLMTIRNVNTARFLAGMNS